jgi:branched-chain amino acid transport system substrate-binding protein
LQRDTASTGGWLLPPLTHHLFKYFWHLSVLNLRTRYAVKRFDSHGSELYEGKKGLLSLTITRKIPEGRITMYGASTRGKLIAISAATVAFAALTNTVCAQSKYGPGASDTEIKIGNTMSYSGPNSAYAVLGKTFAAYFTKINDEGGINGRRINFISYDDAFNPAKTVEQTRRLVESDQVLLTFGSLGTALQLAVIKYLNSKKVPQLFVMGGSSKWEDPKTYPWTTGMFTSYFSEGRVYASYILKERPNAKIAIIYQNDDYGRDLLRGVQDGLGEKASMIVAVESYEITEPTMDTHVVKLKASGADTFIDITPPKFAAQVIRKMGEIGWKPYHIINSQSTSIGLVLQPAGLDYSQGIVSSAYSKDASDPRWAADPAVRDYEQFLKKYLPEVNKNDLIAVGAYNAAQTIVQVLKQCGNDLTRENVMRQAESLKHFAPTLILPGITFNTSPTDHATLEDLQMVRFEGDRWVPFGGIVSGH